MKLTKHLWRSGLALSLIFLAACGGQKGPEPTQIDPAVVFTSAAQTVVVQLTQTAMAASPTPQATDTAIPVPPTATNPVVNTPISPNLPTATVGIGLFTPLPSATAFGLPTQPGSQCDNAVFVEDITVSDGTTMKPGEDFTKVWRIKNSGTCAWDEGYSLAFAAGDPLDGQAWVIKNRKDFVEAGATVDIGIKMTAHIALGDYTGSWRMKNDRGYFFGELVSVIIKVVK